MKHLDILKSDAFSDDYETLEMCMALAVKTAMLYHKYKAENDDDLEDIFEEITYRYEHNWRFEDILTTAMAYIEELVEAEDEGRQIDDEKLKSKYDNLINLKY